MAQIDWTRRRNFSNNLLESGKTRKENPNTNIAENIYKVLHQQNIAKDNLLLIWDFNAHINEREEGAQHIHKTNQNGKLLLNLVENIH